VRGRVCCVLLLGALAGPARAAAPLRQVADADILRAMAEAKRYLWARQNASGHWPHDHRLPGGGNTAIAMFALLEAGESHNNPRIKKGLDALIGINTQNLYVIATRVMALSQVVRGQRDSPYRRQLEEDIKWLSRGGTRHAGAWGYGGPQQTGDNSCSQFALLALWEADRAGVKIHPALIQSVERTWLRRQRKDGGWTYPGQPKVDAGSTVSMTTAGLASLFICQDVLTRSCGPYRHQAAADAAWGFLEKGLKDDYYRNGYLAFCVQRVGMASGRKFMAGMDWFATGAGKLAEPNPYGRSYHGQWGSIVRASFELIFLARGRIPLTYNKLAHGSEGDWNFHARDVPHFTEFMRRNFERRMRWQIVGIDEPVQTMLDAPILLATGMREVNLTDQQWAKLRAYTLRGGTLLLMPVHNSPGFLNSVKARLSDLYAEQAKLAGGHYQLRQLPDDHPLYTVYQKIPNGSRVAPLWGVSDGTRLLAVICQRDLACSWHRQAIATGRIDYALGVNFFLYTTGSNSLWMRMRPVFAGQGSQPRHRAKVAWLRHEGNWCTQPYALEYLSAKLTAENRVAIDATVGARPDLRELKGHHLAWMTGSSSFALAPAELQALRSYLDAGGTLFVNAVGGSGPFNLSAQEMLEKLFAGRDVLTVHAGPDSPLVTGKCRQFRGPRLEETLPRTRAWTKINRQARLRLQLYQLGGRAVVIYAPYGIHDTLDGHTAHDAKSYMPAAARDIAANVVLYAMMPKPAATSAPTTAPAGKAGGP